MVDTIRGPVTYIVDGDTFDMGVTHVGNKNEEEYNDEERIRIAEIDEPELNTAAGKISKEKLEKKLKGKEVRCYIRSRDRYGRIVADVKVLR